MGKRDEEHARRDVRVCMTKIQEILDAHGCVIVATLSTMRIGDDGSKALSEATWGIVPLKEWGEENPQ